MISINDGPARVAQASSLREITHRLEAEGSLLIVAQASSLREIPHTGWKPVPRSLPKDRLRRMMAHREAPLQQEATSGRIPVHHFA